MLDKMCFNTVLIGEMFFAPCTKLPCLNQHFFKCTIIWSESQEDRAIRWAGMHLHFVVWRSSHNWPSEPFSCTSVLWIIWSKLIASIWTNGVVIITSCNGHEYLMADGQLLYITGIIRQENHGVSVIKLITWTFLNG